ncbi:MAG: Lrp/AsnC family transcriptional regulator [Pseudomonadota bacterium]|nr:Lrp/AsnC family transcriptional regulator [Pseudomonadota bacterium]
MPAIALDKIDRTLLVELQRDGSLTSEKLSERVGLSASAIHRRVRRLEKAAVIERRIAVVNPEAVGQGALFIVGIEVERERPELVQRLRAWVGGEPAIQQAYYVTGTADYVMLVTAPDIAAFDGLMSDMMAANPNVRRFTTQVVMSTIKRGLFVPVDS